ncbi:MFS general substrate transporter [Microthyrium microscopicum]|uniref:MFS general substrate transporter n=1 Tax=Microthyrium microscopicum TaxID=703497 RepID=A0A6A6U5N1_9PEZI|nr:MFS general substrate transporter [Microthyrium microscopicum]
MSLAERLSTLEDYEWSRDPSPAAQDRRRKLSFNPVPARWVPPKDEPPPVAAFEVSSTKRIFQVIAAVIYCLFAAGIVFGFAAIKPVLIREEVYRDFCTKKELEDDVPVCYDQELRLNFMFTVAAVSTNVAALPIGTILDRYGPRICGLMGGVFVAIGCALFATAWDLKQKGIDGYIPGYFFLALGGPFIFISSFQLSNTFPRYSGLILALLTGAFDTSSAIFLFYRLIYSATNGTFYPKKFFLAYLVVPVFILVVQTFLMPSNSYKTLGELVVEAEETENEDSAAIVMSDDEDEAHFEARRSADRDRRQSVLEDIQELIGSTNAVKQAKKEETSRHRSGVWGAMHGKTATQQILSPWFVLITLFTVIQMTRINYFVATVRSQYAELLGSYDAAIKVNDFFDVALPLGGVVAIPFIGIILDNTSTTFVLSMLVATATAIGCLGLIPHMWAAYANVCLFVVYRPFYYTCVSDYAAKVFGFHTFGKVYGLIICLAGLFNFSQSALDALTHKVFNRDPKPVNIMLLLIALVVGSALSIFVWKKSKTLNRDLLDQEAEDAEERLMPNASPDIQTRDYGTL